METDTLGCGSKGEGLFVNLGLLSATRLCCAYLQFLKGREMATS